MNQTMMDSPGLLLQTIWRRSLAGKTWLVWEAWGRCLLPVALMVMFMFQITMKPLGPCSRDRLQALVIKLRHREIICFSALIMACLYPMTVPNHGDLSFKSRQ